MNVVNDISCGWINDLDKRSNIKTLDKDKMIEMTEDQKKLFGIDKLNVKR